MLTFPLLCSCSVVNSTIGQTALVALGYNYAISQGLTEDEASQITTGIASIVEIESKNISRGIGWNTAEDKYEKINIARSVIVDDIGINTPLGYYFNSSAESQLNYLSALGRAETEEEKAIVNAQLIRTHYDLIYDAAIQSKERKSQYLNDKMQIREQLLKQGYNNPKLAEEVAGTILAVSNSTKLSNEEKEYILNQLGFSQNYEQILESVEMVSSKDYKPVPKQKYDAQNSADIQKEQSLIDEQNRKQQILEQLGEATNQLSFLNYDFDQSNVFDRQIPILDSIVPILNENKEINMQIIGHTCKIGNKDINMRIGLQRAEAVKNYLISKGISVERIKIDSKGEMQPKSDNQKDNRRIEFILLY